MDILNPHASGKSTLTPSSLILGILQQCTNHAFTPEIINGQRVLFVRQVDDFAIAAPDARTADLLLGMIDNKLTIPVKRQGYLDMYNGIDVQQTRHYI